MPGWAITLIVVAAVIVAILLILYFLGKRLEKRQNEQQQAVDAAKQYMNLFVIDKKKVRIKDAGLPSIVYEQTPWYLKRSKLPVVKVKVGPKVMNMMCDRDVYVTILPKQEVKAAVSGLYITEAKRIRGPVYEPPKRRRNPFSRLFN